MGVRCRGIGVGSVCEESEGSALTTAAADVKGSGEDEENEGSTGDRADGDADNDVAGEDGRGSGDDAGVGCCCVCRCVGVGGQDGDEAFGGHGVCECGLGDGKVVAFVVGY